MAETWVLNKKIDRTGGSLSFNFNFKSNGQLFSGMDVQYVISTPPFYMLIQYTDPQTDDTVVVYNSSNTPAWANEAYRTITFSTPTTNLIEWLQANATQQFLCGANDMYAVADAIRTKAGSTAALAFPDGFVSAVNGIQTGGSGVGHKVTFPATAGNWDRVNFCMLLLGDGTYLNPSSYSEIAGKTIDSVLGMICNPTASGYVLKMTLNNGSIASWQPSGPVPAAVDFTITNAPNATPANINMSFNAVWLPIADTTISAIEMYNAD